MIKSNIKEELKMWKAMPNSHKNDSYYKKHFSLARYLQNKSNGKYFI